MEKVNRKCQRSGGGQGMENITVKKVLPGKMALEQSLFLLFVYCCPVPTPQYKGTCKSHVTTVKTGPCAPFPPDPKPGYVHANFLHSCPTLFDPMDYSTPGSSIHGILQARILEWIAMPSSRESSQPRDRTGVSCLLHLQAGSLPPGKPTSPDLLTG